MTCEGIKPDRREQVIPAPNPDQPETRTDPRPETDTDPRPGTPTNLSPTYPAIKSTRR